MSDRSEHLLNRSDRDAVSVTQPERGWVIHEPDETLTVTVDDFTYRHCAEWCEGVGIDPDYVPAMVAELVDDGPDSTLSWPTIARSVGARFTDGIAYR